VLDMHLKTIPASSGELSVIQQGLPKDRQGHLIVIFQSPRTILLWKEQGWFDEKRFRKN